MKDATALVRRFILSDEDIKQDPLKFVEGWGWDHTKWVEQEFPNAVRQCFLICSHMTHSSFLPQPGSPGL
jgi:hypothetical protein